MIGSEILPTHTHTLALVAHVFDLVIAPRFCKLNGNLYQFLIPFLRSLIILSCIVCLQHRDSVMAMLEAFVHDPLINWRLLNPADPIGAWLLLLNAVLWWGKACTYNSDVAAHTYIVILA